MKKDLRGSGSKENVGRKPNPENYKTLQVRGVPPEIYEECRSFVKDKIKDYKKP